MANGLIWIPKRLVELGLLNVAAQLPQKFVEYCEQDYAARVQQAAVQVRQSGARVVMLTGPSSSGKTTTAHKLAAALRGAGVESAVVSLSLKTCRITPACPTAGRTMKAWTHWTSRPFCARWPR